MIRSTFDARDLMLRSVPSDVHCACAIAKHMMIVADLQHVDRDAIEEAVISAWRLQATA